jgi:hypothetical protein
MTDLSGTIAPKSDQLNADDLIVGPITIKVTKVELRAGEQPIAINFDGDGGKPYMPGKSMRRVMVKLWGPDGNAYIGRSMTIFRDEKVRFGGMAVGGIRISHMTDIPETTTMALTETRASRKPFTVHPLVIDAPPDKAAIGSQLLIGRIQTAPDQASLEVITGDTDVVKQRAYLAKHRPELAEIVTTAINDRLAALDRTAPTERMET